MNAIIDPRRNEKVVRYKPNTNQQEDLIPDYMNILGKRLFLSIRIMTWLNSFIFNHLGMIMSMCGLMMKLKWCAWLALYCSCISFANSRINDDAKQVLSSFMLSVSAVVMSYLQNPAPMLPPWAAQT